MLTQLETELQMAFKIYTHFTFIKHNNSQFYQQKGNLKHSILDIFYLRLDNLINNKGN